MAKSKQSPCPAWPVATASSLFSLPPVCPLKPTLACLPVIFLGDTFTRLVLPDSPRRPQRRKAKPWPGVKSPAHPFSASPALPTGPPALRTAHSVWKMPRASFLLRLFLYGERSASPLVSVTSTSPSRTTQMHPGPIASINTETSGHTPGTELAPALRGHPCLGQPPPRGKEGQRLTPACVPGLSSGGRGRSGCTAGGRRPRLRADPPPACLSVASLPRTWAPLLSSARSRLYPLGREAQGPGRTQACRWS